MNFKLSVRNATLVFGSVLFLLFGYYTLTASAAEENESLSSSESVVETISEPATIKMLLSRSFSILKEHLFVLSSIEEPLEETLIEDVTDTAEEPEGEVLGVSADGFAYRTEPDYNWKGRVSNAAGLRVMWWNAQCRAGKDNTNLNIQNLVRDPSIRPDVLIIGEYCDNAYTQETFDALEENGYIYGERIVSYSPYHEGDPDVSGDENGMRVFSRIELKNVDIIKLTNLNGFFTKDYVKSCISQEYKGKKEAEPEFWRRKYMEFVVAKGGDNYRVAAIHFANPWPFIKDCLGSTSAMGLKMVYGTHNPTFAQARAIANKYGDKNSTLVIGDTNSPKRVVVDLGLFNLTLNSNPYEKMKDKFGRSIIYTFAPTGFGSLGRFSIDHAFASNNIEKKFGNVIPFAGSDHAAIYVVIKKK